MSHPLQSKLKSEGTKRPEQSINSKPKPSPKPQAKPEQEKPVTPKAPEPSRETETQREATEKAKKDIVYMVYKVSVVREITSLVNFHMVSFWKGFN